MSTPHTSTGRRATVLVGHVLDRLREIPDNSVQCVVTSPPYWGLRDYGIEPDTWPDGWVGALGLEPTPALFIAHIVSVFQEVRRVLRGDGVAWVNMGDSYATGAGSGRSMGGKHFGKQNAVVAAASYPTNQPNRMPIDGFKPKDLIGMPWRVALALQEDGWYLRQDIIWAKNNPMPESISDRCTKSHEYIFLLSKSADYFFDCEAIKEKASTSTHSRGGGVNPKAKKEGQHSRIREDRDPRHTKGAVGKRKDRVAHAGHPIQAGLARLSNHHTPRAKQNESFSGSVTQIVSHRNKRSVWTMATAPFKEAHFATFPPALPRVCIQAGTSAKGCCSVCGRPFERITEKYDTGLRQKLAAGWDTTEGGHGTIHREGRTKGEVEIPVIAVRTIGWQKECCPLFGGHAVPCVVMDPFSGAGTTGLVALQMGRKYLGIERSPEYAALSEDRIRKSAPLLNHVVVR
jgi:DNA modification methylase